MLDGNCGGVGVVVVDFDVAVDLSLSLSSSLSLSLSLSSSSELLLVFAVFAIMIWYRTTGINITNVADRVCEARGGGRPQRGGRGPSG